MHPFAVAAGGDQGSTLEVGKVARDLRIVCRQCAGKKADADLAIPQQIDQPQPRPVRQGRKEKFRIKPVCLSHTENILAQNIYGLT